ncbi:MAG: hypothetical protein IJ491_04635 [Clostridia bacterium]|nr:hypothetical protein [Clostridia bacterium]
MLDRCTKQRLKNEIKLLKCFKSIDVSPDVRYNIIPVSEMLTSKKEKTMAEKTKNLPSPNTKPYIIQDLIDLIVGTLLIIFGELISKLCE